MTAVVVGGGVAGLVAARRLAIAGERVTLLEATERLGGRVKGAAFAGTVVDTGAESFATRGGAVAALLDELGLAGDTVEPVGSAWVALPEATLPLPAGGLLGIPGTPLDPDVRRVLGTSGALRAHLDRLVPVVRPDRYLLLGPLVRARMGRPVLDRLVAPVVENVYGVDPETVPVDAIAPGLRAALVRTGALSAAVVGLRAAAPPGAAARGVVGGMHRLVAALHEDLAGRGATVRVGAEVIGVHPAPHGPGFTVVLPREDLAADRVVLAADGAAALDLLKDAAYDVAVMPRPEAQVSRAVLLAVDDERLDAAPRGTGVLRAPSTPRIRATALTHLTAKWPWLRDGLPAHRHLLRLAYRGPEAVPDAVATADAAALLGTPVTGVVDRLDAVWTDSVPPLDPRTTAIRARLAATALPSGLAVGGSWTAGTGLAAVVAGADALA